MFVVNPGSQSVLRVITDKEHYYPVRRLFNLSFSSAVDSCTLLGGDRLLSVGLKEIPELDLRQDSITVRPALTVALAKAVGGTALEDVTDALYGWAVGLVFDSGKAFDRFVLPIAVSHLRPKGMAPDILSSDMWLYVNNHEELKLDLKLKANVAESIARLGARMPLGAGDVLMFVDEAQSVMLHTGDTVRAGVTGVGMLSVKI